jgi:hypothetical protein
VGQRAVSGPRFPIGLRGATTAFNANVNTTMRKVPPGRHVFVARDPGASAGDESFTLVLIKHVLRQLLCFLDAYSGYHQIKMKESD